MATVSPCKILALLVLASFALCLAIPSEAVDWQPVDPNELQLKDLPEQPGAPAFVLYREEIDNDQQHFHSEYVRIKILSEAGRKYADVQIPYYREDMDIKDVHGRTIHPDGSIVEWLAEANEADRMKYVDHYLGQSLKNVAVQKASFGDIANRGSELVWNFDVSAQGYSQHSGPLLLVRPRVVGDKTLLLDWAKRKYPVQLSGTTIEEDAFEIQLPPGFVVDDLPEPAHIDVGFAKYSSKVEAKGSTLHYTREYVVSDPNVAFDHLTDLHRLENVIAEDEFANAVLKKTP